MTGIQNQRRLRRLQKRRKLRHVQERLQRKQERLETQRLRSSLKIPQETRCAIAEIFWLAQHFGSATADLWHEKIRPDLARTFSNRHFERAKANFRKLRIPYQIVLVQKEDTMCTGILPTVSCWDIEDAFGNGLNRNWSHVDQMTMREMQTAIPHIRKDGTLPS